MWTHVIHLTNRICILCFLIYDFSRKTWIYFLKGKNEVFNNFKEFKALIENHTERKVKTMRLYNGGEFTSEELKELCRESGIKRELSTPYNPQWNGIAERKNKTIMEVAKAMLHDQDISKERTKIRI